MSLLLFTLLLRLIWGWYADRQMRALLDEYRRRGQPVRVEDLKFADVPDAQNAWFFQMKAAAAVVPGVDSPRTSALEYRPGPPYPDAWTKLAAGSEAAHGPVFAQLRKARQFEGVQVHKSLSSPMVAILLLLFIVNSVYHMWLGMQVIIEDYVHHDVRKLSCLMANTFFCTAAALASVYAILKLSFGV